MLPNQGYWLHPRMSLTQPGRLGEEGTTDCSPTGVRPVRHPCSYKRDCQRDSRCTREQIDPSHELFTIYDYTKVWIEANLLRVISFIWNQGRQQLYRLTSIPANRFPLRFVNFENIVDPATRTLRAIYEISNPKMLLRPGMVVNVNIESEKRLDALVVQSNSIMDWEGQKVVFCARATGDLRNASSQNTRVCRRRGRCRRALGRGRPGCDNRSV